MAFLGPSLRRRKVSERPGVRVAAALLLSLLLNGVLIGLLVRAGAFDAPRGPSRPQAVALAPLTADQWDANRAIAGAKPPAVPPAAAPELPVTPPPPPREDEARGQVVDVAPSQDSAKPKDSRFLSDRDNTVEKETRSRFAGTKLWENTLPSPSAGPKGKQGVPAPGDAGAAERSKPGPEAPKRGGTGAEKLAVPEQKPQERLATTRPEEPGPGDVAVAPKSDRERVRGADRRLEVPGQPGEAEGGGARQAGRLDPRLLPDAQSMERIAGGPSPDRLDGVDEGDATRLNTRGWKYATFFTRVVRAIYQQWDPNQQYDARDPRNELYAKKDRTTAVDVVLDDRGELRSVVVRRQSGLAFLDEELVRAVRAAAPFPNPPIGLLEDGQIRIPLAMTLHFNSAGGIQVVLPSGIAPAFDRENLPSQRPYPSR
jgi:TonB family protein